MPPSVAALRARPKGGAAVATDLSLFTRAMLLLAALVVCYVGSRPPERPADFQPDVDLAGALSFPTLWKRYRRHLLIERRAAPNTVITYRKALHGFEIFIRPKAWQRATIRDLQRFLDRPASVPSGHLAANSQRLEAVAVCGLYRWAWRQRYVATDRMGAFTPPKGGQPRPRSLEADELRQLFLATECDDRLYCIVSLMLLAGLRCCEVQALRVENVDLPRRWMVVDGKGDKQRAIPIHPELAAALRRYLAGRAAAGPLICSIRHPSQPLTAHTISTYVSAAIRGLGIANSAHGLRHSFILAALEVGGEEQLLTVSRLAGHAGTGITERTYLLSYKGNPQRIIDQIPDPRQPPKARR
jgi:site-specific recombinase XerD